MRRCEAEIVPCLGLGGLLLGQSLAGLDWEEQWSETGSIVRGSLSQGCIEVIGDSASDQIIGLVARPGYQGCLPQGIGLGTTFPEALQRCPQLRLHDLDGSLYEPDQLGFVLLDSEEQEVVSGVQISDWAHDYWTYARPLLQEEECGEE